MNRHVDEARRVVRNRVLQAGRETRGLRPIDGRLDALRDLERVGAGLQKDTDQRRVLAVIAADEVVVARTEFDARNVAHANRRAIRAAAHDDVFELLRICKPTLRRDRVRELLRAALVRGVRCLADLACRKLRVLLVDCAHNIARRQLQLRQPIRPQPDPHRVVLGAEDLNVGRARQTLQLIEHVQRHVVRREQIVEAAVGRIKRQHLQERRRSLSRPSHPAAALPAATAPRPA